MAAGNPPLGHPLRQDGESPTAEAEKFVQNLHAQHPDGCPVDSRDLPGWNPPPPLIPGDQAGPGGPVLTLDQAERQLGITPAGNWPGR
jgi:hypothetical protein